MKKYLILRKMRFYTIRIAMRREACTGRIGRVGNNTIRQEKNIGMIFIVLASRAAISGGLSPKISFTMADAFIIRIERVENLMQIRAAIFEYEIEFVR